MTTDVPRADETDDRRETWIVTNDDGIDAPGLVALRDALGGRVRPVVVAPASARSECGHAVTTSRALRVDGRGGGVYAVDGTPVDCVRLGLHHLASEARWVVSGINAGGNLGTDVFHSGTVSAVREAAIRGLPGAAFSLIMDRRGTPDWRRASGWCREVLNDLLPRPLPRGSFWNVNFPYLDKPLRDPEIVYCNIDTSPLPLAYRLEGADAWYSGVYRERERRAGGDIEVCLGGRIAVSRIDLP
jgi:5'-nucleotidase